MVTGGTLAPVDGSNASARPETPGRDGKRWSWTALF